MDSKLYSDTTTDQYKDSLWITVTPSPGTTYLIGCIYRSGTPHTAIQNDNTLHMVLRHVSELHIQNKIILGDFNLNKITWDPDPSYPQGHSTSSPEAKFVECIRDTYLYQLVTQPTRYREGQRPTMDDLIFTSEENLITQIEYLPHLGMSDHICISGKFGKHPGTAKAKQFIFHYDRADYTEMAKQLDIDWESELTDLGPQETMDRIETLINEAVQVHIPKSETKVFQGHKPLWMTKQVHKLIKRKHHAWTHYMYTKHPDDYCKYTRRRNETTHAIKKAKRSYEYKIATESKENNKAVWRYVKSRLNNKSQITTIKLQDGSISSSDLEAAESLNEQFFKVFTREDTGTIPTFPGRDIPVSILDKFIITPDNVKKELTKLKVDKTPGLDGMHPRILKEL